MKLLTLRITEKSSVRHKIDDGGSGVFISWISSKREERSLILLIMVEIFLTCITGSLSIDATSLDMCINDSSNDPVGRKPEETMRVGRATSIDSRYARDDETA